MTMVLYYDAFNSMRHAAKITMCLLMGINRIPLYMENISFDPITIYVIDQEYVITAGISLIVIKLLSRLYKHV